MFIGIAMLVLLLVIAVLMFMRKLPTIIALPILAISLALIAGVPLVGKSADGKTEIGILANIIEAGATRMASAYVAVIFGAWLGQIMNQTGIAKRIIKLAAELGGDRPMWIAIAVVAALTFLFTTMSGLGSVIMLGTIVIPILVSVGIPPLLAGCTFFWGMASGLAINVTNWAAYMKATGVSQDQVYPYALTVMALTVVTGLIFLFVEFKRAGVKAFWAAPTAKPAADEVKVNLLALLTPIVPLILVLALKWTILPALLAGILYALITTYRGWNATINLLTKSAFDGVTDAAPAVILMIGIGMVLNAVFHPNVSAAIGPMLKAVVPTSLVGYILFFALLAPLALYRGPLNMFGLGAGVAGLMISLKLLPAPAVMSALLATERMQVIGDPTNSHNVWMAGYTSTDVNAITLKLLPWLWGLAAVCTVVAGIMYV
jgi:H+/gluconate symporter-like permease